MPPAESCVAVVRVLYLFMVVASLRAGIKPQRVFELLKEHLVRRYSTFLWTAQAGGSID